MRMCICVLVVLAACVAGVVTLVVSSGQDNINTVQAPGSVNETNVERVYHTLQFDFQKVEKAVVDVGNEIADVFRKLHITDGCECSGSTCGCCSHIEEDQIHLNATACVNVTYLSQDYGISITATLNKYTIYNETVSAKNPPPICAGAPYVKDMADLCIRFHDVEASRRSLRACAAAEARFKHVLIAKYELGCFAIGQPAIADTEEGRGGNAVNYEVVVPDMQGV